MTSAGRSRWRWAFFFLGTLLAAAPVAQAQLFVDVKMERRTYIAYEPVYAIVTVQNRSGRQVILGGPNGRSWVNFQIKNHQRHLVNELPGAPIPRPRTLATGKSVSVKIPINSIYPVNQIGNYRIRASVYYSPLNTYFDSPERAFTVDDGRPVWNRVVGNGKGKYQRYTLLTYRDRSETRLYYRLADERTGIVRKTYSIGRIVNYRRPQVTVDGSNHLHVLYMGAPREYVHASIDSTGKFLKQSVHKEEAGNRPELVLRENGKVTVRGGFKPEARLAEKREKLREFSRIRFLSERPIGF